MDRKNVLCFLVVTFLTSILAAETVKIPLPEITGQAWIRAGVPGIQQIPLNLQTVFSRIDQVSLQVAGKIYPTVDLVSNDPVHNFASLPGVTLDFTFDADPAVNGNWNIHLADERFNASFTFQDTTGSQNWDFLLDGQAEIIRTVDRGGDITSPGAKIFEAYLVIEGTVLSQTPRTNPFPILGDANHDTQVDVGDLGILAANYGCRDRNPTSLDLNGDGLVDVSDLSIVAANGCLFPEYYTVVTFEQGDFNYDGIVDVGDLGILAAHYNGGGVSGGILVPEPLSLMLFVCGGLVMWRKNR